MRWLHAVAAAWLAVSAVRAGPQVLSSAIATAKEEIQRLITASGADVAVAWRPARHRPRGRAAADQRAVVFSRRIDDEGAGDDRALPAGLHSRGRAGRQITVSNRFHSIVDQSPYELSSSDDSDGRRIRAIGTSMTLRSLCEAMITVSSNLAANNLIEKLGPRNIQGRSIGSAPAACRCCGASKIKRRSRRAEQHHRRGRPDDALSEAGARRSRRRGGQREHGGDARTADAQ